MLYLSREGEIINTEGGNSYYKKALEIIDSWDAGSSEFEIKTSGSTGIPKLIRLSRENILASIQLTQSAFNLTENDLFFCCLNIENIAGLMMTLRSQAIGGELLVVEPSSEPFSKIGNLSYLLTENRGRNFFAFVPLQLQQLLEDEKSVQILRTAKTILVGGAAVSPTFKEQIAQLQLPVFETYGMTETISHVAIKDLRLENESFKILDGVEIKTNENACLQIKSPSTGHQWIQTNDIVELIDNNNFKLLGRLDNVINSGGVKLQLEEIERKIAQKLAIPNRFFCFGISDVKLGQKLILVVESKEKNITKEQLSAILSKFEVPKEIFFVEKFLETSSSKVDKRKTIDEILNS